VPPYSDEILSEVRSGSKTGVEGCAAILQHANLFYDGLLGTDESGEYDELGSDISMTTMIDRIIYYFLYSLSMMRIKAITRLETSLQIQQLIERQEIKRVVIVIYYIEQRHIIHLQ